MRRSVVRVAERHQFIVATVTEVDTPVQTSEQLPFVGTTPHYCGSAEQLSMRAASTP